MKFFTSSRPSRAASRHALFFQRRPLLEILEDRLAPSLTPGMAQILGIDPGSVGNTQVSTASQTVATTTTVTSSANPSLFGRSVTLTATVAANGVGGGPTGTVQFQVDGNIISSPVNLTTSGGVSSASFSTTSLPPGTHAITANYSGDSRFAPSSGTLAGGQTVNFLAAGVTTTTVTSSASPSAPGQSVTFTATINPIGAGTPTGTVLFVIDGTMTSGAVPVSTSKGVTTASLSTTSLTAGIHVVTARYSGDGNFGGSTGALLNGQVVAMGNSSTSLSSSSNPSSPGQAVTFTATVTSNSVGGPTPTGTVQFVIDGGSAGSPVVLSGSGGVATATFTTSSLAAGSHSVTAIYSGDSRFAASSGSLSGGQTVGSGPGGGGGGGGGPGNVIVSLTPSNGVLRITGYNDNVAITIQGSQTTLQVSGAGTLVNGLPVAATFPLSSITEIDVALLNGNDNVVLNNFSIPGKLSVIAGSGSDNFSLNGVQANIISLSVAGPGMDTVSVNNASAGSANITAGANATLAMSGVISAASVSLTAGNNATVNVNNLTANGDLNITAADNTQSITVKGSSANNLNILQTGTSGNPLFDLENDAIKHNLNLNAGGGNNTLVFSHLNIATQLLVALGKGKNRLSADNVTALFGTINGGTGSGNTYINGGGNSGFAVFQFTSSS